MTKGRILTLDNLRKRKNWGFNRCCICKNDWELVDHLLIHCPFASDLWSFVFSLYGICWVMPMQVVELLVGLDVLGDIGRHTFGVLFCSLLCRKYRENGTTESLMGRSALSSS